jgi:hypothetical protein
VLAGGEGANVILVDVFKVEPLVLFRPGQQLGQIAAISVQRGGAEAGPELLEKCPDGLLQRGGLGGFRRSCDRRSPPA